MKDAGADVQVQGRVAAVAPEKGSPRVCLRRAGMTHRQARCTHGNGMEDSFTASLSLPEACGLSPYHARDQRGPSLPFMARNPPLIPAANSIFLPKSHSRSERRFK